MCVFVVLLRACLSVGVLFGVLLVVFVVFVVFVVGRCRSLVRCFPFSRVRWGKETAAGKFEE